MIDGKLWLGAIAISALAIGCGGNNRDAGTQGAAGTSGTADVNGSPTMTLTGCVQEGTPVGTYVLRSAPSGQDVHGTSGKESGGQGAMTEQGETTYRLIATGNLDLGQNLGKQVSVTGQLATQAQDNTGAAGTSGTVANDRNASAKDQSAPASGSSTDRTQRQGASTRDDAAARLAAAHFFRVTSMTKIADTCTSGGAQEQR